MGLIVEPIKAKILSDLDAPHASPWLPHSSRERRSVEVSLSNDELSFILFSDPCLALLVHAHLFHTLLGAISV